MLRTSSHVFFQTSTVNASTHSALKKPLRRGLVLGRLRRNTPELVTPARDVRLKDIQTDRRRTVKSSGERKLLTPYELSKRVKVLCDKGQLNEAISKLKEAPRDAQNAAVWGTLIHDVMEAGKYKEAYRLFTDMKRRGFTPTTRTYSTMLGGYSKIEDWDKYTVQLENVCSIYEQLKRHHEEVKQTDPRGSELSDIPYNQLIKIFGQAQQFQRMYDVFNSMPSEGRLAPSIHTYTELLNALSNRKASSLVPPAALTAEDGEVDPSEPSYHELMLKNSTDAKLIWRQLVRASTNPPGFKIDSHALRALLKILGRGRPSDQNFAFDIVHEYFGLGKPGQPAIPPKVDLHPLTLESLLVACNNAKRYNLTLHYAQQVIDSDSGYGLSQHPLGLRRILNTRHMDLVLEAYASRASLGSSDESDEALETLEWMHRMQAIGPAPGKEGGIGQQIRPAARTYELVALACWRSADWKSACRVFELMTGYNASDFCGGMHNPPQQERRSQGRNLVPTPAFMSSLIRAAAKTHIAENMQQALNILEHYSWDTFLTPDIHRKDISQKEKKDKNFYASRLAQALVQSLPAILKSQKFDKETKQRWVRLQRRAEAHMNAHYTQADRAFHDDTPTDLI